MTVSPIFDKKEQVRSFIATFVDITARTIAEAAVRHSASDDPLTDLPNRRQFNIELARALQTAAAVHSGVSLLSFDLDQFNSVNDQLSYATGDKRLVEVAPRLRHCTRDCNMVARLGGDEFAVIVTGTASRLSATKLAERTVRSLSQPIHYEGLAVHCGIGIGVTSYPVAADSTEPRLRQAQKRRALGL